MSLRKNIKAVKRFLKASSTKAFSLIASASLVFGLAPSVALAEPTANDGKQIVSEVQLDGPKTVEELSQQITEERANSFSERTYIDANGNLIQDADSDYTSAASTLKTNTGAATTMALTDYPERFDLRNATVNGKTGNFVSEVKNQGAFSTCWSFGTIAAAETALQSEEVGPITNLVDALNFSEKQLAWFTFVPWGDDAPLNQAGEGLRMGIDYTKDSNKIYEQGGNFYYATSLFAMSTGPVEESVDPLLKYQNANGDYIDNGGYPMALPTGDWTVPDRLRGVANAELEETFYLPSTASFEPTDTPNISEYVFNPEGVTATKEQLMQGRAVAIIFSADTSVMGRPQEGAQFINPETFAHYTYLSPKEGSQYGQGNHAVCIVGWDDTYSKDNFQAEHKPPEDGAWIVKNSWGSNTSSYGNQGNWGVDNSGYFYLSYYDKSVENFEAFDFITPNDDDLTYGKDGNYSYADYLYNFLPGVPTSTPFETVTSAANVFTIASPSVIRSVSTQTLNYGTNVRFDIYKMGENATNPSDGTLVWSADRNFKYGGYHRVELDTPLVVNAGEKLAIVTTTKLPNNTYETVGNSFITKGLASIQNPDPTAQMWGETVINPGESFFGSPGKRIEYSDGSYTYNDYQWVDYKDNVDAAKAVADKEYEALGLPQLMAERDAQYNIAKGISQDDPNFQTEFAKYAAIQTKLVQLAQTNYDKLTPTLNCFDNFSVSITAEPIDPDNPPTAEVEQLFRVYNQWTGEHLYTKDINEKESLVSKGWKDEGVGWTAPKHSNTPVYRAFNQYTGEHFYTSDAHEFEVLKQNNWNDEGIAFYSDGGHTTPIYRLFNPHDPGISAHHYTQNASEKDELIKLGWRGEGIGWYSV